MRKISVFMLIAAIMMLVIGCSGSQPPVTELKEAMAKQKDMKSYSFDGDMKLSLDIPEESLSTMEDIYSQEMVNGIIGAVNGATLKWEGTYEAESLHAEIMFHLNVPYNGAGFTFDVPVIMNGNELYMKIPMVSEQYVYMNLSEEMEKATGETVDLKEEMKKQYELQTNVMNVIEQELKDYFKSGDTKAYSLSDGKVSEVITFELKEENTEAFIKTLLSSVLPKVIEELKKSSFTDATTMEQLEQYEQPTEEEINEMVSEITKSVTINSAKFDSVIDKEGFVRKNVITFDIAADVPDMGKGQIGMTVNSNINNINNKAEFKLEIPNKEDTIPMEELGMFAPTGF